MIAYDKAHGYASLRLAGVEGVMPVVGSKQSRDSLPWKIANGTLFNLSWLAIVSTQSAGMASVILLVHMLVHFAFLGRGLQEVRLVVCVLAFGALVDQVLFKIGVFTLAGQPALAPLWLTSLWPVLATTFMHAFRGLQERTWLAAAFGAVGGSGSYIAGTQLSAVDFGAPVWGPVIVGLLWALLFPLLLRFTAHLEKRGAGAAR